MRNGGKGLKRKWYLYVGLGGHEMPRHVTSSKHSISDSG